MVTKKPVGVPPRPWRVSESNGGKWFMYDANNEVIIIPNVSSTGKTQEQLVAIYNHIVKCVNANNIALLEEQAAWERAFPKVGGTK